MRIELPQVGESVTEGTINKWLKQVGERVEKYDPIAEVVTDKVTMEMPSPVSGVITALLVEEGQTVPMGAPIVDIEVEGEAETVPGVPADGGQTPPAPGQTRGSAPTSAPQAEVIDRMGVLLKDVAPVGPTGSGGPAMSAQADAGAGGFDNLTRTLESDQEQQTRRRYSPAVLRLAEEHGVDLSRVNGTGINGRITRKDVQDYIDSMQVQPVPTGAGFKPAPTRPEVSAPAPEAPAVGAGPDEERVPLAPVRRMIADNMVRSASQIPAAWCIIEVDVTGLMQRREAVRGDFQRREGINITYLPFVVKAVAESLKENPLLNSSWGGDAVILKKRINIGIAVAAPGGLVVPVIHDADTLSIAGLAKRIDDLTARARQGRLALQDVQGGTFTLNNTGALGSVASQPIINYPQAAILTTEAIVKRPVILNDAIAIRSMMNICLTFDHRIMDGSEATAFTSAVKKRLEAIGPDTGVY
jgi:2-oxoisovalerate dehydrogenase E2 component (dihydrolipoyl transacylase)